MIDTGPGAGATAGEYTVRSVSDRDQGASARGAGSGEGGDAVSVSSLGSIEGVERPAQVTLEPGLETSFEFEVAGQLLTDVGGTIGVRVLSTPGMVGVIERTCAVLALENLPEGRATVGFEICVKHVAASLEGARCVVHARLREIVEDRKLRFDVEVRELAGPDGQPAGSAREGERGRTIGVGTHERRVIDVAAHAGAAGS
jgi:predicted thioesterase